jgi:DNA-binding PadR family transcriptional regulator
MPGHGKGRQRGCRFPRQRRGMRLMLRPCLLLMLSKKESHGYELFDELKEFGFNLENLDSSVVYRDLREMEDLELIESYWDEESKGPKKRVYRLLDAGKTCLDSSLDNLIVLRDNIDQIIQIYKQQNHQEG